MHGACVRVRCCVAGDRCGLVVSAEDDIILDEEEDDDLDASVETDEGVVGDDVTTADEGEAVAESDAEKVSLQLHATLHCTFCLCSETVYVLIFVILNIAYGQNLNTCYCSEAVYLFISNCQLSQMLSAVNTCSLCCDGFT